jgi:uncharacterized protein (DUF885 family)
MFFKAAFGFPLQKLFANDERMIRFICAIVGVLAGSVFVFAAEPAWVTKSNEDAKLLLKLDGKYSPEGASSLGLEEFDDQISDFSRDLFDAENADTRAVIAQLEQRLASESDGKVKQDLQILIDNAQDRLRSSALSRKYFFPFYDLTGMVYDVTKSTLDPRISKARQKTLLTRLEKYAGLAAGFRPISELARERTIERLKADPNLRGPFKDRVEKALSDAPILLAGARELLAKSELKNWEKTFATLEKQLTDYNGWVKSEILPRAATDYRLPPEVYADRLHNVGVDIAPEELISRALTSFAEIRNQMNVTASLIAKEHGWTNVPDYKAAIRELKKRQLPKDEVMPTYLRRLSEIESIVREHRIVTLPNRKAAIRLATEAENAAQPAPHMRPPRLIGNTGEYGEFVLTTGMSPDASGKTLVFDDFTHDAGAWTLTAHEARPGHELQFAKIIEAGVSTARAVFAFNSVNVEGWALYAEAEMQPYEPLDGQLFALQHRGMRAARAFLDPMVNLGKITPEQVKSFLMDEVILSEAMATQEMQRYTFRMPGQAPSYFYGYQRIMETRQAAQLALRGKFDRLEFNDFVLSQGLVPPKLLRKAVMEEFVPANLGK